jgi:DNA repair protein RAD50
MDVADASAILKYHSIKMDEINDTIGHLWNKTYQGTGELEHR